ncbi:MAG TPA: hypothetical protein VN256_13275 [Pyrinomonadaceae bacterium]|nr:hypothetical protein [Pyrinomonadaceae bacterium]
MSGAFPDGKTFCLINESIGDSSTSERVTICRASNDQINVTTATGGNPTDGLLYNHSLEIRVYD